MYAVKRKLKTLTVAEKRIVIETVDKGVKKKHDIAKDFGIPANTLSTILKNRKKYEDEELSNKTKRFKSAQFADVEESVTKWMKECCDSEVPIPGPVVKEKAIQFATVLGHHDFRASNGWLQRFKKRNETFYKKVCGGSASLDNSVCDFFKSKLVRLTKLYSPEDVFNADETGLFFKCLPNEFLTLKGDLCKNGEHSRKRITVLLCVNSTGSDKLKPLVVGKISSPKCFKNVDCVPTDYKADEKAWMNPSIFNLWLQNIDSSMEKKNRKILLFVDNCTAHRDIPVLKNVKVEIFPANTTSERQPLDQGVVKNFKINYRKEVVKSILLDLEDHSTLPSINILNALWMTSKAWDSVSESTVLKCFKRSGFNVCLQEAEEQDTETLTRLGSNETVTQWTKAVQAFDMDQPKFEEFVDFDKDIAVCDESHDADTDITAFLKQYGNDNAVCKKPSDFEFIALKVDHDNDVAVCEEPCDPITNAFPTNDVTVCEVPTDVEFVNIKMECDSETDV